MVGGVCGGRLNFACPYLTAEGAEVLPRRSEGVLKESKAHAHFVR